MAQRLAAGEERVAAAIRRMIDPDVAIAGWRVLAGGTGARCFAVEVAGHKIVAKLADTQTPTAISIEAEFRLLEHAASIGVAPRPIGFDRSSSVMLCEYVDAAPWQPRKFHSSANIERLAERLRMLHTIPTGIRRYEPVQFAETYRAACGASQHAQADSLFSELCELAEGLIDHETETVVCHNDLHITNILPAKDLLFIDFEYAVAASPIVDLASLVEMNRFDSEQSEMLVARYYRGQEIPFDFMKENI